VPTQQIAMSKLKGKTVYYLGIGSGYSQEAGNGFASAARAAGLNPVINSGVTPEYWNQAIQEAVARHAAGILVGTGIVPALIQRSVAQATAAGIPTVQQNSIPPASVTTATVLVPTDIGDADAAAAALDTGCKVNALVGTVPSEVGLVSMSRSIENALHALCPATCKTQDVDINLQTMSTTASPELASALRRNPSINTIMPVFDSLGLLFQPALTQSGSKARVYSLDGDAPNLANVRQGKQAADYAFAPTNYEGYALMDALARAILKVPVNEPPVQFQLFTTANIPKSDSFSAMWPKLVGFQSKFMKVWGLS
jgi:ribose transport system substrate-binding protein